MRCGQFTGSGTRGRHTHAADPMALCQDEQRLRPWQRCNPVEAGRSTLAKAFPLSATLSNILSSQTAKTACCEYFWGHLALPDHCGLSV